MCVRLSVCPHWTTRLPLDGFSWNLISDYFWKICWDISSLINIWQEQRVLYMKNCVHFLSYLVNFFLEWKMFQTKLVEKLKTHILCSVTFFLNRAFYEIMWKNIVEWGRQQMLIWRMHIACRITKAINAHTIYNTYCSSTTTTVTRTRLSGTLYVECLSC